MQVPSSSVADIHLVCRLREANSGSPVCLTIVLICGPGPAVIAGNATAARSSVTPGSVHRVWFTRCQ